MAQLVERDLPKVEVPGSNPGVRSISGVSSPHHQGSAAWTVWWDVQGRGPPLCSDVDGAARSKRGPSREVTTEMEDSAPVTELAYVSALEAEFWEFKSPLGHHFHWV
jgi:hypothetical protein